MSLPPRDTFGRQWLVCGLLALALGAGWRAAAARLRPASAPSAVGRGTADWFLVVRMPAVTAQYESGIDVMRARYDAWLEALSRAGFQPIRLSEALARLESGRGLPERSVVAVFEPGMRRTQEIVDPILRRRGWPALWLTDSDAMRAGHREFVTHRTAREMTRSGWWDVGYSRRAGGYEVRSRQRRFTLGGGGPVWSRVEGTFALNRGPARGGLNVLTINPHWLAPEVVDRLRAELPYERRTCLAKAVIHNRDWGVAGPAARSPRDCAAFDLEPPFWSRDTRLHWLGTTGVSSLRLALEVESVVGELRVQLLRDEASGRQVSVVFGETTLYVDEWDGERKRRLLSTRHGARRGPISAVITLDSGRVSVRANDLPAWVSPPLELSGRGTLFVQVAERMRGVARARGLRLTFEPAAPAAIAASRP